MPLSFEIEKYYEAGIKSIGMDKAESREYAVKQAYDMIRGVLDKKTSILSVVSVSRNIIPVSNGGEEASVIFECLEEIAMEEKLK